MTFHVLRPAKQFQVTFLSSYAVYADSSNLWALIIVALPFIPSDAVGNSYTAITTTGYEQRRQCRRSAYKVKTRKEWSADQPYIPGGWGYIGGTATTSKSIPNTPEARLYQSERNGNFSYKFDVPSGSYNVTLRFAETHWEKPGQRKFDVFIEGRKVTRSLRYLRYGRVHESR